METDNDVVVLAQHSQIAVMRQAENKEEHTQHPDAQWFASAGLGVFLHWGISSVDGEGDLSWGMMYRSPGGRQQACDRYGTFAVQRIVPPNQYWKQAERFTADNYDPNQWIAALRAAGVNYVVLTTKHHDGFALWPSAYGDFSTKNFLNGRDLVGEFVAACRAHGMKVGLYYSPPDWWFNRHLMSFAMDGEAPRGLDHELIELPELSDAERASHEAAYLDFIKGQTEELLTRYDTIDLLWFDGSANDAISLDRIRELQPGIIVNRRGLGVGDFETPECAFPIERIDGWWEYCHIWNDGAWGYQKHETYKPLGWVTNEMAKARGWGGNFLINMGPDSQGKLPEQGLRRIEQLAAWMHIHRDSIFDVSPGPWPERSNVPVTVRGDTWFVHVNYLVDYDIVLKNAPLPASASWKRTGEKVAYSRKDGDLILKVPSGYPSADGDVIAVQWR